MRKVCQRIPLPLLFVALILGPMVQSTPLSAASTEPGLAYESGGLTIQVVDVEGGRHVSFQWTNLTPVDACITILTWTEGDPRVWASYSVKHPGDQIDWTTKGAVYSVFQTLTFDFSFGCLHQTNARFTVSGLDYPNQWSPWAPSQ
jgi:hypothetical protein